MKNIFGILFYVILKCFILSEKIWVKKFIVYIFLELD